MKINARSPLLTSIVLALCLFASLAAAAEGDAMFPYPSHIKTLDNGLQVILIPMSAPGLLSYWTIVRTGSRDEYEPGRTGFAHFFEHMMFRGTEKYPAEVYNDLVTKIGAGTNAFTSDDMTAYYLDIATSDLETVMDLESDRFMKLAYPVDMFKTEAGAVYGEYRKNRMSPFFLTTEAVQNAAFDEHTYGHTAMGYEDDIKRMPELFEYSRTFFERYYRPDNILLVIVGDLDVDGTFALVERYYGAWQPGYVPPKIPVEPPQNGERRIQVPYPGRTLPLLWMSYKHDAFAPGDRVYAASTLLCELTFGSASPLYRKLVLEDQVVEVLAAQANVNRDPGLIDIIARVKDPSKVADVEAQITAALAAARETPPDAARLADLKSRLKYEFLMHLDTPSGVAESLVRILAVAGRFAAVDELYSTYQEVTPDDIVQAAQRYFATERRTVAILEGES